MEDIDGKALYDALEVDASASLKDIKRSYRALARQHHPDKGGDPTLFGKIQHSYEVLSDPKRRNVYDTWAKELEFRYVRPKMPGQPLGGEDVLLDEFETLGLHCDPATQLVVTCEVCRRPATKECWTCGMPICEFCTLKRHWRDGVPLHWPLINSDHMKERLAQRELEQKRLDDARRMALEDPNHRSEAELKNIRSFKDAAQDILKREDRRQFYDLRIARFYMWAQTDATVYIACQVPTGYGDRELVVECIGSTLLVQSEDSPPLIDRYLDGSVDSTRPIETMRTEDNRVCAIAIPKSEFGQEWPRLFRGDPDGARSLKPPYEMIETVDDAILQIELPFWIDPEDVMIDINSEGISANVRGSLQLRRTYWRNHDEESKRQDYCVVDVEESCWSLEEDIDANGEDCKLLTITLARPPLTQDEITWKKGQRQDNRAASRPGSMHKRGFRFFADDEDEFDLEDILQALCFSECGKAWVPPKPWEYGKDPHWVRNMAELPPDTRNMLLRLKELEQKLNEKQQESNTKASFT